MSNELLLLPICGGWDAAQPREAARPRPNRLKNNADKPCKACARSHIYVKALGKEGKYGYVST
jgi:hypothetical protein